MCVMCTAGVVPKRPTARTRPVRAKGPRRQLGPERQAHQVRSTIKGELVGSRVHPSPLPVDQHQASLTVSEHVAGSDVAVGELPSEPGARRQPGQRSGVAVPDEARQVVKPQASLYVETAEPPSPRPIGVHGQRDGYQAVDLGAR